MHFSQRIAFRSAILVSTIAFATIATCAQAQTYNFRVVHHFSGAPDDGGNPVGTVQFDAAGNLYGTADDGTYGAGVIFKIARNGTETIIHSFDGASGGAGPQGVTIDPATGDLYGATGYGGDLSACSGMGCGVLYKLAADGTFIVLHDFDGDAGSWYPNSRLLLDQQGNLYGTTSNGGENDAGTIFKYGADGGFTVLHSFAGPDGSEPRSGVVSDSAGNLYGITYKGGSFGAGSVYTLTRDGNFVTLHSFTNGSDGGYPLGGMVGDGAGNLYGTTSGGGDSYSGTVFKLTPEGVLTTLHGFTGITSGRNGDGAEPVGDLLRIGNNLYGTTRKGGHFCKSGGCGTVFKLAQDGTETILHAFTQRDIAGLPYDGLAYKYGRLFGTAFIGVSETGGVGGPGTVFSIGVGR